MSSESPTSRVKSIAQDLRGKDFVVTGANTGIGYATARELAKMGASVTLACRNGDKGQQAVDKLRVEASEKPVKEVRKKHLSSFLTFKYVWILSGLELICTV